MALIATTPITAAGIDSATLGASASTFTVDCSNGHTFLEVKNASGSSINVTLTTPGTNVDGDAVADRVIAVPATTGNRKIWLNPATLGATADVALSATTSVTVSAFSA